jgi:hypothetical protein
MLMSRSLLVLSLLTPSCHARGVRSILTAAPGPPATALASEPAHAPAPASAPAPAPGPDPTRLSPYDLQADVGARIADAKSEFGTRAPIQVEAEVFVVVGAPGWGRNALRASTKLTHDALAGFFNDRFRTRPARAISVYLFPSATSYEAYCSKTTGQPCISPFGFYQPASRDIVMNAGPGLGTLTHELVHPILETDFPGAPTWIDEGIASLFEQPVMAREGEIHGGKNWRWPRLIAALTTPGERGKVRLEKVFAMSDETFRGVDEKLNYAMARYLCQWLDAQGKLWPFYQAWRDGVKDDATGEKAFAKVVGKAPAEATDDWVTWVRGI